MEIKASGFDNRCVFCAATENREIILENHYVFAILDAFPVSEGHTLIIPRRHIPDYFEMTEEEQKGANELLRIRRDQLLESDPSIKGFNVGVNCGKEAGQTIFHAHIHLIPRRSGDTPSPKGGVRGVIPDKMSY
jgi:diadenosine tetraphosphate (Ap4A) HIT family hydrolase